MPTIQHSWKCDICGQEYGSVERAESCEVKHTPLSSIKVVELRHDNAVKGFPADIVITINNLENENLRGTYEVIKVFDEKTNCALYDRHRYNNY